MIDDERAFLQKTFEIAVDAANPLKLMHQYLPKKPKGRTVIIGAGKGAAQMAAALEKAIENYNLNNNDYGDYSGLVVTRYGYGAKTKKIEIVEAAHPVPDENGFKAAKRLMHMVEGLTKDDLVIALICGGGSALLPAPLEGLSLADKIAINEILLKSGAPITAMNTIRKHLSQIKGGRLAAKAYPAKVVSLVISDIPGDVAAQIASGPTIADITSRHDALKLVKNYNMILPQNAMALLNSHFADAPKPDDAIFTNNEVHIIASAQKSLEAAAVYAKQCGINAYILSDSIEGEAKEIALMHGALAKQVINHNQPFKKPALLLSGGETTVTITGAHGKGGRNSEFILALALNIRGVHGISALAADTDGIDGSENNAGAFCDGETLQKIKLKCGDIQPYLNNHDAFTALQAIEALFVTGPTSTNVNDFRAIYISDTALKGLVADKTIDFLKT